MPYVDLNTIHNPATGNYPPAAWGDAIRDNFAFLIDPPRCGLSGLATTCGNLSFVTVDAQVENYDSDSMHTGTNDYMTIQTSGTYLFTATVQWAPHADSGHRLAELWVNSTDQYTLGEIPAVNSATYGTVIAGFKTLHVFATDNVRIRQRHQAGANLDATLVEFTARWIGQ